MYQDRYSMVYDWFKVKRKDTNEIGFVCKDYVQLKNALYVEGQDCDKIENGNWYELFFDKNSIYVASTEVNCDSGLSIRTTKERPKSFGKKRCKNRYLLCSEKVILTGEKEGICFNQQKMSIGDKVKIYENESTRFFLGVAGRYYINEKNNSFTSSRTKIYFISESKKLGKYRMPEVINSTLILEENETNYYLHFSADLNDDSIPDFSVHEVFNDKIMALHLFLSNSEGGVTLKSTTFDTPGC